LGKRKYVLKRGKYRCKEWYIMLLLDGNNANYIEKNEIFRE